MQGKEKAAVNPDTVTSEAQLQKELDKKAQELLEEKEADSRMRTYIGPMSKILVIGCTALRLDGIPAVFYNAGRNQCH